MSELIRRLRALGPLRDTRVEAADEIDRLRAALRGAIDYVDELDKWEGFTCHTH